MTEQETAPTSGRPVHVTIGGGILIAAGSFVALVGMAVVVIGLVYQDRASLPAWADLAPGGLSALAAIFAVGALAYGTAQTVTGIGLLSGATWTRPLGFVLAAIGAALATAGLLRLGNPQSAGATMVFMPVVAGYLYTVWVIAVHPRWFAAH